MSNSSSCVILALQFAGEDFRLFSLVFYVICLCLIVIGVTTWLLLLQYSKQAGYLRRRGSLRLAFVSVGWVFNLLAGPVARSRQEVTLGCVFHSMVQALIIPVGMYPVVVNLFELYERLKYNQRISTAFVKKMKPRSKLRAVNTGLSPHAPTPTSQFNSQFTSHYSENTGDGSSTISKPNSKLFSMKDYMFHLAAVFVGLVMALTFSINVCSEFRIGPKTCILGNQSLSYTLATLIYYVPGLTLVALYINVSKKLKQKGYLDPFEIVYEAKLAILPAAILVCSYLVLNLTDPFGVRFDEDDPKEIKFFNGTLIDIACSFYAFILIYRPIYVVLKGKTSVSGFEKDFTLAKLLSSDRGRDYFRRHCVHEFSIENLNFYYATKRYIDSYAKKRPEALKKSAERIYKLWISERSPYQVNISFPVKAELEESLKASNFHRDLFVEAQEAVFELMSFDTFERFQRSALFKQYLAEQGYMPQTVQEIQI